MWIMLLSGVPEKVREDVCRLSAIQIVKLISSTGLAGEALTENDSAMECPL